MSGKTDLYRYYEDDGVLLYVGISSDAYKRAKSHAKNSEWFIFQDKMTVETFDTRKEARAAEKLAIVNENPVYNKEGKIGFADARYYDRLPSVIAMNEESRLIGLKDHKLYIFEMNEKKDEPLDYVVYDSTYTDVLKTGTTTMRGMFRSQVKQDIVDSLGGSYFEEEGSQFIFNDHVACLWLEKHD